MKSFIILHEDESVVGEFDLSSEAMQCVSKLAKDVPGITFTVYKYVGAAVELPPLLLKERNETF